MSEQTDGGSQIQGQQEPAGEVKGGFFASLVDIFIDPIKVFRRIDGGLAWWKAYIVVSIITIILGWLNMPMQRRAMELGAENMSEEQVQAMLENMERFGWMGLIIAPIGILVIYLIIAGITHLVINIISMSSNFKKTLSLISFCGLIGMVEQIIKHVIIRFRGIESIQSMSDLKVSFGLAALFPELEGFWFAFLESLSIFQIWYLVLLLFGIATIFKIDLKKSAIPVLVNWLISLLVLYVSSLFGGGMG